MTPKVRLKVPSGYSAETKRIIAQEIIMFIIDRSARGLDRHNRSFKKYSKEYAEEKGVGIKDVDVIATGDMLDALKVLKVGFDFIEIGYDGRTTQSDKAEGNITGSYGGFPNPDKARDFLGLTELDLKDIIKSHKPDPEEVRSQLTNDNLLRIARNMPKAIRDRLEEEMLLEGRKGV